MDVLILYVQSILLMVKLVKKKSGLKGFFQPVKRVFLLNGMEM